MAKPWVENLFILAIAAAASVFSLHYGMEQFGGYDLSPIVDLQSRLSRGETPGVDIINTLPLTMVFILKIYGALFKASWVSLLWSNIVVAALCVLLIALYWPPAIPDYIEKNYARVDGYKLMRVYRLRE